MDRLFWLNLFNSNRYQLIYNIESAAKKYPPELSAIFQANAWNYNAKFYTFITCIYRLRDI